MSEDFVGYGQKPSAPKPPCHVTPVFGCSECIERDRNAWAVKTFEAWKKTYKPRKCARHKKTMFAYQWHFDGDKIKADMSCPVHNDGAHFDCEDQDYSVVIG